MSRRQLLRFTLGLSDGAVSVNGAGRYRSIQTISSRLPRSPVEGRPPSPSRPMLPSSRPATSNQTRCTSFWTQSYPPASPATPSASSTSIPYAPPSPDELAHQNEHSDGSSDEPIAAAYNQDQSRGPSKAKTIRSSLFGYGSSVTVAGHGQNVHVLDGEDQLPQIWESGESYGRQREGVGGVEGSETVSGLASETAGYAQGAGASAGLGRRKERKNRYLDSLMDKAGELNLRYAQGEWTLQEGRFKKAELCKEYDLDPRDLRKLDSLGPNLVPIILTRRTCILISILHVRALIKPDKVILFDVPGSQESEAQRRFKMHLERNVKAGQAAAGALDEEQARAMLGLNEADGAAATHSTGILSRGDTNEQVPQGRLDTSASREEEEAEEDDADVLPYEHRALESILVATANALEEEMAYTRSLVKYLLADLEDDINRENLKKLLHYSRRMVGFQSRARYVKRAVDEILDNDEDLSAMYLTATSLGRPRALHDHEQLELLLESFTKQVEEIVSEIDNTVANIQSTQEIAELMLDSGRNALLALDIKISFATLGAGCAAVVAGVFGMNLSNTLESSPYAFLITTASASILGLFIFIYGLRHLRRVRRVALSDRPRGKRSQLQQQQLQYTLPLIDDPSKLTWDHLPSVEPLIGASQRHHVDRELVRRSRAEDKRKIWDMISRARSAPRVGATASVKPGMIEWRAAQVDAIRQAKSAQYQRYRQKHLEAQEMGGVAGPRQEADLPRAGKLACGPAQEQQQQVSWEPAPWKWGRGKAKWNKE